MAQNLHADGSVVQYTAGGTISAGDVVGLTNCIGIALVDMVSGDVGSVAITGVWEVTKLAGATWSIGESIDYDTSAGTFETGLTAAAGDVVDCGVAYKAAASGATVGYVLLTPGTGTAG